MSRKLTLADIADLRAYERERTEFRARMIELKKRRRIAIGPHVTVLFENRETIRFQVQEMARAEKIISDEGIETELRIYNPLIPEPGELTVTMFVELTSEADLREWLPKLAGIERSLRLRIGEGADSEVVVAELDADHARQLTREETTASVHYLHFRLDSDQIEALGRGPVHLELEHPAYTHAAILGEETVAELLGDLGP